MPTFGFFKSLIGTQQTRQAGALNLVALKDADEAKDRSDSNDMDKKRPRRFSEERALSKANALSFFQDAAFGGGDQEDDAESFRSRKSSRLDKENDEQTTTSSSPSPSKSAKKRRNKRVDMRNKELVKQKRRLRVRN